MNQRLNKITAIGILSAMAFAVVAVMRIPVFSFLDYEAKDIVIAIGGFIFGPLASMFISIITSFFEWITISDTGPVGFLMNVISSCAFACTAAAIYKKRQRMSGAVIGLLAGTVAMVAMMLLWNYFITPYYMNVPRAAVVEMLIPVFLPFNLLKASLNAGLIMLVYKPVVSALRAARLVPPSSEEKKGRANIGVILASATVVITCVLVLLAYNGIL